MLCADGQADCIRLNALFHQFFRKELHLYREEEWHRI